MNNTAQDFHPESRRDSDLVFNPETCRALRQRGHDAIRQIAPVVTFLLFGFVVVQAAFPMPNPWLDLATGLLISLAFAVTIVAEIRWIGVSFYRDIVHDMKQDFHREIRAITGDHEAIESRVTETGKPPARPELAFNLPPEECILLFVVLVFGVAGALAAPEIMPSVLFLGGGVVVSALMFVNFKYVFPTNTYPPEDPPHER